MPNSSKADTPDLLLAFMYLQLHLHIRSHFEVTFKRFYLARPLFLPCRKTNLQFSLKQITFQITAAVTCYP